MIKVIVLGGGLVGGPMALDLAKDNDKEVTVCDINREKLNQFEGKDRIQTVMADINDEAKLKKVVADHHYVINAVPGFMGFTTLKRLIEAGKDVIDIAFFPENLFDLDDLAKKKGVTVISDIGVAPGMSNVLIGYADHLLDKTVKAVTYVGGLPKARMWPFEYKAVFSPIDVIEEYTRPARYIENGREVIKPALSDPEFMEFEGIGTLEAFNSDGLRSLAHTIEADYMIEKTLRYPGHIDIMKILRHTGFFSNEKIDINGTMMAPMDLTSKLLFPIWKLNKGEEDLTIMKIIVEGTKNNEPIRYTWDLFDHYDQETGVHSMARTTGYTATMALRMVASGLYKQKGVSAPEFIGRHPDCVEFMLNGLKERNVNYHQSIEKL
jgi:saccharopine dehydrogenase-like NADP-dependent oxidoreductase